MSEQKNPVTAAISIYGTQERFAKELGITRQAVSRWIKQGEVPMRQVQKVSDMTKIPIWVLNPTFCRKPSRSILNAKPMN